MKAYALDLRERVLRARNQGHSAQDVAKQFSLSKRTVERYWRRYQDTGQTTAGQMGGHRRSRLATHDATLRAWIGEKPDLTLAQLQQRCREQLQVRLGVTALWHRLERLGLSYKKTLRAAEQTRPALAAERVHWWLRQAQWDVRRLVFLDETCLNTQLVRRYGRAAAGARCVDHVPHGHWRTATFLAALRHDRLTAPLLLDGPLDGELFLAYLEQSLGPTLQPGDLVICDNLASHKVAGVREVLAARGAELRYLPAYSPDLNPIELAFAKLKAALRAAAAREWDELLQATAAALTTFTPKECAGFLRHARYAPISIETALARAPRRFCLRNASSSKTNPNTKASCSAKPPTISPSAD